MIVVIQMGTYLSQCFAFCFDFYAILNPFLFCARMTMWQFPLSFLISPAFRSFLNFHLLLSCQGLFKVIVGDIKVVSVN